MHGSLLTISGIPEWFYNTGSGPSDIIQLPDPEHNRKWIGCAMFIDYEVYGSLSLLGLSFLKSHGDSTLPFRSSRVHFKCKFETNDRKLPSRCLFFRVPQYRSARGIWVYIPAQWFPEQFKNLDKLSSITIHITTRCEISGYNPPEVKIKNRGARLVYEHNGSEFFRSIAPRGLEHEFYRHLYYFGNRNLAVIPPLPFIDC